MFCQKPPVAYVLARHLPFGTSEQFAYLLSRMKLIPEDDGTLVDYCCLLSMHEHAEANVHNNGLVAIRARHSENIYLEVVLLQR